jgi:UDP-glucose 4-epimerase
VTLRYFNVAGADPLMRSGEVGRARHLIKIAAQIAVGARRDKLQIFGADYATPDGTAIRDYVHVSDIAQAHVAALEYLRGGGPSVTANVGYGRGYSVREVVNAVARVTGADIPTDIAPRRAGDPPQLIADCATAMRLFSWRPRHDDLDYIVGTAIEWERRLAAERQGAST